MQQNATVADAVILLCSVPSTHAWREMKVLDLLKGPGAYA